jgi:hypothetical protein
VFIPSRGLGLGLSSICLNVYLDPHGHVFTLVELYNSYSGSPVTMDKHVSKNASQNAHVQAILLSLRCLKPQTADDGGPPTHLSRQHNNFPHDHGEVYKGAYQCD